MRIVLGPALVKKLVGLPESGMGYQIVDLILSDGRKLRNVIVFNSEEVEVPEELVRGAEIADVEQS